MELSEDLIDDCRLLFEAANGFPHDFGEQARLAELKLRGADADALAGFLVNRIQNPEEADARRRASVFWALGKRYDRALLPFFRKSLKVEVAADSESVYQILIALDNLDERVFGADRDGGSCLEKDLNRRDAMAYLARQEPEA